MTITDPETPAASPQSLKAVHAQRRAYALHLRRTFALADRVRIMVDGSRWIVRFKTVEVLEHWLVLITFLVLGVSGLLQLFASLPAFTWVINTPIGGIDNLNLVHQVAALFFAALFVFHFLHILTIWFVKREPGSMLPRRGDYDDLVKMIRFNLGVINQRPLFGRFTIEEKLGYWALLIFAPLMLLTGLILWVPGVVTQLIPAVVIQVARSIHGLTGLLAVIAVLIWHLYFSVFKDRNSSIFTGLMSEQSMKKNHPLELERIIVAFNEIQQLREAPRTTRRTQNDEQEIVPEEILAVAAPSNKEDEDK